MTEGITIPAEPTKKDVEEALGALLPKPAEISPADKERERRIRSIARSFETLANDVIKAGIIDSRDVTSGVASARHLKNALDFAVDALKAIPDNKLGLDTAPAKRTRAPRQPKPAVVAEDETVTPSSNPEVATVEEGVITGHSAGSTTLTAPMPPEESVEEIRARVQQKQAERASTSRPAPATRPNSGPVDTTEGF
jgi:hypothetical protein